MIRGALSQLRYVFALLFLLTGFSANAQQYPLEIDSVAPGIWRHVSFKEYGGKPFPSNGLIVQTSDGVVLIDTPWNAEDMPALFNWVEQKLQQPIRFALITHAHDDRIAGADQLSEKNIPVYAAEQTYRLAKEKGLPLPTHTVMVDTSFYLGGKELRFFYPGPGHTVDNQLVYLPESKLLFTGCFSKNAGAKGLGNVADADLEQWPLSVKKTLATFSQAELVVPGHGETAGLNCLHTTARLLDQH